MAAVIGTWLVWFSFVIQRQHNEADIRAACQRVMPDTVVTLVYYAVPPLRRWVYLAWMYAAFPIGWVVSHVVLAAVYYLIVTPIGLAMRALGRDPLNRRFDRSATTYWIPHNPGEDVKRYFRQF